MNATIVTCPHCDSNIAVIRQHLATIQCECGKSIPIPPEVPRSVMVSQIAAAVAAEREACAKIAEQLGVHPELNVAAGGPKWYQHGKDIARAIRARKDSE